MPKFCFPHKWGEWSKLEPLYGLGFVQYAKCKKCGAVTERKFGRATQPASNTPEFLMGLFDGRKAEKTDE